MIFFYLGLHVYRHLLAHSNFMPMIPALLGPYYFLVNLIFKSILLVSSMFGMKELLRVHVGPPMYSPNFELDAVYGTVSRMSRARVYSHK